MQHPQANTSTPLQLKLKCLCKTPMGGPCDRQKSRFLGELVGGEEAAESVGGGGHHEWELVSGRNLHSLSNKQLL